MDKTKTIDGVKVAYSDVPGNNPAVVLMHGWGCNRTTLASIEKIAVAEGRRVINVDFPGFGESEEPPTVWGVEEYTRMMEKLLREINAGDDAVLLGHSFGGRVGILYASRNKTGKLVLVDAAGVKPKRPLSYYWKVYRFKAAKMLMKLMLGQEKAQKRIDAMRAKRGSADYAAASPRMREILSKVVNEDLTHVMPSINCPTLLVWGEKDTATPMRDARIMERLIPDAGLVSFAGCGHYSFLDNPGQFAAVLRSFMRS